MHALCAAVPEVQKLFAATTVQNSPGDFADVIAFTAASLRRHGITPEVLHVAGLDTISAWRTQHPGMHSELTFLHAAVAAFTGERLRALFDAIEFFYYNPEI